MPEAARAADEAAPGPAARRRTATAAPRPRRTITITGQPDGPPPVRRVRVVSAREAAVPSLASRVVHVERRRPARRARERFGSQPDRLAMWAVLMAFLLILVAAISSHS